ncbi:MAG: GreA/GreB family elongation factor [Marinomonas sp.]
MNKKAILNAVEAALEKRFETAKSAAIQARQAATSEESVAENKYDTFGLEASYLAHGQSQRVLDCENEWLTFNKLTNDLINQTSGEIALWSVVGLSSFDDNQEDKYFFISSFAGGLTVELNGQSVFLVTPSSPVGKTLLGKEEGEEVVLFQHGTEVSYEIETIL